ncbi:MAG: VOC family protein [Actinobacteria bacterium]|nr:VOC family protein [Actinomycetota bacterium]
MADNEMAIMLMFAGQAEEASGFYTGLFADSSVEFIERYGPEFPGPVGQVVHARFRLNGQLVVAMDSAVEHAFTFTPSTSFFLTCASAEEVDRLYAELVDGGSVMMALDSYPFAKRYAWVQDRFGVSWQLMFA